jgi:phosphoesterase RecJ-like protein
MKNLTRNETGEFLRSHDNFCILTHRRPDGDTLGSAAALCLGLRKLGKNAWVLNPTEPLDNLDWLLADITKDFAEAGDTILAVDVAAPNMLPRDFAELADKCLLRIDHHGSCTPFAPEELVDAESASCAEIIYDLLTLLGVELDEDIADAIYVGVSTDTGCFRYANTNAHAFLTASACAGAGADVAGLNLELFETNSLAKLRLHAWIAEHVKIFGDGELAIVAIPKAVEESIGVTDAELGNLSSYARSIEGVCLAATLRQGKYGETKVSIRAVPGWDAAAVCARLGGGGHPGAGGATTRLSLEETAKLLEEYMLEA